MVDFISTQTSSQQFSVVFMPRLDPALTDEARLKPSPTKPRFERTKILSPPWSRCMDVGLELPWEPPVVRTTILAWNSL